LNAVVAALRDVKFGELRAEMTRGFAESRAEMKDEYASLRYEIMRTSLSLKIWMLSIAGTLLAVMAHGFKWL
jgi:hypothetical protein